MEDRERTKAEQPTTEPNFRVVDLREYTELVLSRRKLERMWPRETCLRDLSSGEFFQLSSSSDLRLTQRA
jgi:hypothetical protein